MPAQQHNALDANPNDLNLSLVTRYARTINANLERVWENVLDFEHLAFLHNTSFENVTLDDAGDWGWRVWSSADRQKHIELAVDKPAGHYVARSYEANDQISEIWTYLTPVSSIATDIRVEFHVPDLDRSRKDKLASAYRRIYQKLWDEDEAMMVERQYQLDNLTRGPLEVDLGQSADLGLPIDVTLGRHRWRVVRTGEDIAAYPTLCPHLLGPLPAPVGDIVTCPWHGYQFNLTTGQCIAPAHATCRLPKAPDILDSGGRIILRA